MSYGCWIHGRKEAGERLYSLIDPATGEPFAQVTLADERLVRTAVESAREVLEDWRRFPVVQRAGILHALAGRIREQQGELTSLLSREVGKPIAAAREEVLNAASVIDYFAEEGRRLAGQIPLLGYPREHVLVLREPIGVVGAITPFNYPLSTLVTKLAPALAVGCTVVAKPDEHTPLSTLRLAQLALETGLPPGAFNVITGSGPETGRLLVENSVPRLIAFTGSTAVGKEIQARSAVKVRKVVLELGGHCPAILCTDAPWQKLLPQIIAQSFKNCGQYCYRISRIYVSQEHYAPFLEEFIRQMSRLRVGLPTDPFADLGPLNNTDLLSTVRGQVERALEEGACLHSGKIPDHLPAGGFYCSPAVLTEIRPEMAIMHEEVFGPVVLVRPFKDVRQAVEEANATPYGLAAYLFTKDLGNALEWAGRLEVGSVWINRIHQAYPEVPFGGMKESGLGREKSHFGIEEYTELKTVYLSY